MELGLLDVTNPAYDPEHWAELRAIVKGGKCFKALITKFLPQNPVEPADVYAQRRTQAHYTNYVGSIINLYTSWLFAASFSVKAYNRGTTTPVETVDKFYGEFQENVGAETQLRSFMKERFREALTSHKSYWLVEMPSDGGLPPEGRLDYEQRGLGRATLKALDPEEILDWEVDEKGQLIWAMVHTCFDTRESWALKRNTTVETWRVFDRELVHTFQLKYEKGKRPKDAKTDVPRQGPPVPHGFKRVPIVCMHLPREVTVGEQTFDQQLEHFRLDNAKSWLIRRTCYAQPVFNLEDGESTPPRMGTGHAIMLGPNDKMGWTSPPNAPFDVLQKNVEAKREEIYRVVHQMAQAVDNNAETVGRSADSKEIDAAATRIMLNAYGELVSKSIEETYELISEARDEAGYEWSVEGFSGYDTATVSSLIANAREARGLGIPSETFERELCTKVALAFHPEVDQRVKDTIRQEIHTAKFTVSSKPAEAAVAELNVAKAKGAAAKAKLDKAKAAVEPVKAKAAVKAASQPKPNTGLGGMGKPQSPKK